MKNCIAVMLAGAFAVSLAPAAQEPGKGSYEDVVKQMIETMDSLSQTLATIKDEESAKESQPTLKKTAAKWQSIKKQAESLPPPSREEKDRLAKQFKVKLEEAQKKLFGEVARVSLVPGGRQALLEISSVLEKKSKQ